MLLMGFPLAPGNTSSFICPFFNLRSKVTNRGESGIRKGSARCLRSFSRARGIIHTGSLASRSNSHHSAFKAASVRTLARIANSNTLADVASRRRNDAKNSGILS